MKIMSLINVLFIFFQIVFMNVLWSDIRMKQKSQGYLIFSL